MTWTWTRCIGTTLLNRTQMGADRLAQIRRWRRRLEFRRRTTPPSRSASVSAPPNAACGEKPSDHENDQGTDECDHHRAENRMPDDRDAPVEDAGQKTAHQCTYNACDYVTHNSQAMAQCQMAREESGHEADDDPHQNRVEIQGDDHMYQASFVARTRTRGALRAGLIACQYRAAEWRHKEIELAAHELLQRLDKTSA